MKTHHLTYILLFFIVLSSCNKEKQVKPKYFEGSYDWISTNSYKENGSSGEALYTIYPNDLGHHYGLKIKRSGKCYFYKDGNLLHKGEIGEIHKRDEEVFKYGGYDDFTEKYTFSVRWEKANGMRFTTDNSSYLICTTFPEDSSENRFVSQDY